MLRKRVKRGLTVLGLGALPLVSVGVWGIAGAAAQAPVRPYTGQVREIKIAHCGLEPEMCAGSLVLVQVGGQQVALAIPAGTAIHRGDQRVHLEELGVGNYVTVQAAPLPSETGDPLGFVLDEVSRIGDRVGMSSGERPVTLKESSEN
jgi:hypothetical protein